MFSFIRDASADYSFKLVLIGPAMSGKSTIFEQLREGDFTSRYEPTTKSNYLTKRLHIKSVLSKIEIWDTPGQEKHHFEMNRIIKGCDALVFVYDPTSTSSIAELKNLVGQYGNDATTKNVLKVIVANKSDLVSKVTEKPLQGAEYQRFNLQHYNLCAKKTEAVEKLLEEITKKMIKYQEEGLIKRRTPDKRPDELMTITHLEIDNQSEKISNNTVIVFKVESKSSGSCSQGSCKTCAIF